MVWGGYDMSLCGYNDGSEQVAYCLGFDGVSYPNDINIRVIMFIVLLLVVLISTYFLLRECAKGGK